MVPQMAEALLALKGGLKVHTQNFLPDFRKIMVAPAAGSHAITGADIEEAVFGSDPALPR